MRARNGLALLFSHDQKQIVGRARNLRVDADRTLRADLHFREGEVWNMVRDGDLTDVSVGYHVTEYDERDDGTMFVTRWTPAEVSMVSVPADHNAGIGRAIDEGKTLDTKLDRDALIKQGVKAEQSRRSSIDRLFEIAGSGYEELHARCLDEGLSLEAAQSALHEATKAAPKQEPVRSISGGEPANVREGMSDALLERSGLFDWRSERGRKLREKNRGNEFRGMRVPQLAEYCLKQAGVSTRGLEDKEMIYKAMQTRAVTGAITSLVADFPALLADQINKSLLTNWEEAPETYAAWTQVSSAADFKTGSRVHLSAFNRLTLTAENTAYPAGEPDDFQEPFTVKKYGALFHVSIEALTSDDLSGLTRVPGMMGRAAAATVGDVVYAILTANGTMSDSNALFDAVNHGGNLVTAGGVPDADAIWAGRQVIALQTDNHATEPHVLGLQARYVLVPLELEKTARIAVESTSNPVVDFSSGVINPLAGRGLVVLADPRLSADSAEKWYMAADTGTVEVIYLNGQQAPMVDSEPNFDRDGIMYRVRLFFTAIPVDWRGLFQNDGATP